MKSKIHEHKKNSNKIVSNAKIVLTSFMSLLFASSFAQDRTTVNATSSEISDNLDLRAVASIFGDSKDLADFEFRLNDPKTQISNLDLNNDNQVDYLRVIESIEGNVHLIVIQAVLGHDQFQDVATVEVEKDNNNRMQVQVVGDVYMYGRNYIYEPVYVNVPVIYNYFWVSNYRPYCSSWYWGYYPSYYTYWSPFPIFRYRHHIGLCINFNYQYNYVNYRRCEVAYNRYYGRRTNYCERQYPNRSFEHRNSGYTNRYELDRTRTRHDVAFGNEGNNGTRNFDNPRGNSGDNPRGTNAPRGNSEVNPRGNSTDSPRNNSIANPRSSEPRDNAVTNPRSNSNDAPRNNGISNPRSSEPRDNAVVTPRSTSNDSPRSTTYSTPRSESNTNVYNTPRGSSNDSPRSYGSGSSSPRSSSNDSPRSYGGNSDSPRSSGGGNSNRGSSTESSGGGGRSSGGGRR
jgi:uncharacterized membrane protein YgcG